MSAKRAANALIELDCELFEFSQKLKTHFSENRSELIINYVRQNVLGTWTLTLSAKSAGVSEQQIIAAIFYSTVLKIGTSCVAQGEAKKLFKSK